MFKKIAIIGGARPNFMKVAPLCTAFEKNGISYFLVNTGQHFSKNMSADFFEEFGITPHFEIAPRRDDTLMMIADIKDGLENIFVDEQPDLVLVVGDVHSTRAAAEVAKKLDIKLGHIEAGLRSYNNLMPEEHNRVVTDRLSDYLFVTCDDGVGNLKKEGISEGVYFVGNLMIDTLAQFEDQKRPQDESYYFCTLHRAENVDSNEVFVEILDALEEISKDKPIYLPLHPRTKKRAEEFGLMERMNAIFVLLDPLSYSECVGYQKYADLVLTDSGGIQEETTYLGVPCLTLRTETERPVTVSEGTNCIGGVCKESIISAYHQIDFDQIRPIIHYWDGKTSERIIHVLEDLL